MARIAGLEVGEGERLVGERQGLGAMDGEMNAGRRRGQHVPGSEKTPRWGYRQADRIKQRA
jgi:hypothetical protein